MSREHFLDRISRGPAALLLGQSHLGLGRRSDPLVDLLASKTNGDPGLRYDLLLADSGGDDALVEWLDAQSRTLSISDHLRTVSGFAWIGIWSSAIDSLWAGSFDRTWREVQPVLSESYRPSDPRNRRRLHCTYLYGAISRSDIEEKPPTSVAELIRRRGVANALARRIVAALGPTGTLAIEGYDEYDWFRPEDLAGVVSQLQPGQVYLFGCSGELSRDPSLSALVGEGHLIVERDRLAEVLSAGAYAGRVKLEDESGSLNNGRLVSFAGSTYSIPRDIWVQLTTSARVLDEELLAPKIGLTAEARYSAFREFLGSTGGPALWDGISRGFVFRRDFEPDLESAIRAAMQRKRIDDAPIVVHGATGTGKSLAIAHVAYRISTEREYPVLYVDRRAPEDLREAVDRFCIWAEQNGAELSVVFWDAMHELAEYERLKRYFASRGRQIVLVGSAYRSSSTPAGRHIELIAAPDTLTANEVTELSNLLGTFSERLRQLAPAASRDGSFLVALYRLLPSTRSALRAGVVRELARSERVMVAEAGELAVEEYEAPTVLARALYEAGLVPDSAIDGRRSERSPIEEFSLVQDLTALVMVPAQHGLDTPLELVLRAVGRDGFAQLPSLLRGIDLVRWIEDGVGNYLLGARSPLEAHLVISSRLGTVAAEIAFARRLIREIREGADEARGDPEVDFAVRLLRALGAQGQSQGRYRDSYAELADELADLRKLHGIANPRLILQEANLRREVLRRESTGEAMRTEKLDAAERDVSALSVALYESALALHPGRNDHLKLSLEVERASGLATLSRAAATSSERVGLYQAARQAAHTARRTGESSYYPLDVLAWASRDVLQDDLLPSEERVEVIAELLGAFEVFDVDAADIGQIERFHSRRQELADLVGDVVVADESFDALLARGSAAGVYLRAREIASLAAWRRGGEEPEPTAVRNALEFLNRYAEVSADDPNCLNLAFDLWWLTHVGSRPFEGERVCMALDAEEWVDLRNMCTRLLESGQSYRRVALMFLRGLAEFHLRSVGDALSTFDEVEQHSDEIRGRRRIVRAYLASDVSGAPVRYQGTVNWVSDDLRRGEVHVDALRQRIRFIPSEFRSRQLARGSSLGEFHIGFNYLGVIADPIGFFRPAAGIGPGP